MDNEGNEKRLLLSVLGVAILIIAVIGISFAAYSATAESNKINSVATGNIMVSYTQSDNSINIDNALPMDDAIGKELMGVNKTFDFVVSTGASNALVVPYEISLTKVDTSTLLDSEVKVYLTKNGSPIMEPVKISDLNDSTLRSGSKVIYKTEDVFEKTGEESKTTSYVLRMWIDKDTNISNGEAKEYKLKVNVDSVVGAYK